MKKTPFWFIMTVIILLTTGFAVILHHFLVCGRLFDTSDLLHHEPIWVMIFSFTFGIIVSFYALTRKK